MRLCSLWKKCVCLLWLACNIPVFAPAQNTAFSLSRIYKAFSAERDVESVRMEGAARWYAGDKTEAGAVILSANNAGASRMQISLNEGSRVEQQSAIGENRICTWAGPDGVTHNMSFPNCMSSVTWFLPHLSLRENGRPIEQLITAGEASSGLKTVNDSTAIPALDFQLAISDPAISSEVRNWSKADLELAPDTMLPSMLRYSLYPEHGFASPIRASVSFSDYRIVSGVWIPFHIQRYINGTLQLDIELTSVSLQ